MIPWATLPVPVTAKTMGENYLGVPVLAIFLFALFKASLIES
jgi:hypothetical protein